jgi:cyclopropane-fatty-acyl-phospholipid synthase
MNSRVFAGEVAHVRSYPVTHTLKYPLYFFLFDLDELDSLNASLRFFSYNRFNVASLRDRDYLVGDGSIRKKIISFLEQRGVHKGIVRIELLTMARYFNYVFNPVSFYFCYDKNGKMICAAAEVNNTFDEKHLYILTGPESGTNGFIGFSHSKQFHVSPFNNREGYYDFSFNVTGDAAEVRIVLNRDGHRIMAARLFGKGLPLTAENLSSTLLHFPFTALMTMPRILKEAFKLFFIRKLPYVPKPEAGHSMTLVKRAPGFTQRLAIKIINWVFAKITDGCLEVTYPDGTKKVFGSDSSGKRADISIHEYRFFRKILFQGDIGLGESFVDGGWTSSDPVNLLTFLVQNLNLEDDSRVTMKTIGLLINNFLHTRKANTIKGSRKNISEHYDLGNDFFNAFLDETMMYSCGIYKTGKESLNKAQLNKIHRIIDRAGITAKDHVLEIGSGWGGFACEAAKRTGCRVTTITISKEQHDYVQKLIKKERLESRVNVEIIDFRKMKGTFDKIVSIEMLEAVGHENFGSYFSALEKHLKPGGTVVLQVITTPDHHYKDYRKRTDWIQKYIFPGGHLPSLTALSEAMAENSRLCMESIETIGSSYVLTLREWTRRFLKAEKKLLEMGYDRKFQKKWLYYLHSCEAGFGTRIVNDVIITLARSGKA